MAEIPSEKFVSKALSYGAALTTIVVVSGSVTDPVNAPKMLILGITGFSVLTLLIFSKTSSRLMFPKFLLPVCLAFISWMFVGLIVSEAPLTQTLYGAYGRNTGVITYTCLAFVLLAASTLSSGPSFSRLLNALIFSGIVNLIYCLWVILFGDFIAWSNTYRNILGTLGNPNFIGSFLGIFLSSYVALVVAPTTNVWLKRASIVVIPVAIFEIMESNAVQGRVVAALGLGIVGFFYVRARFGKKFTFVYAAIFSLGATLSLMGALQIGPLTSFIYKTSVSLRGQYWLAGWNTGQLHPFSGVGMDSFGDWYRRTRSEESLVLPGVNTVVNAAHNVFLDIFASGGWPLAVLYFLIQTFTAIAIFRFAKRAKEYDPIFVSMLTAWLGYQAQSIISINQIGLAIWGWALGGSLIAYERFSRLSDSSQPKAMVKTRGQVVFDSAAPMYAFIGGIIGLLIAVPPLSADIKWRAAQLSRNATLVEQSLIPTYFNPPNTMKYVISIDLLERSNLFDLSHSIAVEAVKFNPDAFELWKMIFLLRNSTTAEKEIALENMKRLDPLNPDVTS